MDKILLAALLKEWLEDLVNAIHGLEAFPPLRDGRQKIIIEDLPELANLWSVKKINRRKAA
jgi:hypothetical protein